jgi:hypothetical protein
MQILQQTYVLSLAHQFHHFLAYILVVVLPIVQVDYLLIALIVHVLKRAQMVCLVIIQLIRVCHLVQRSQ